MRLLQRLNAVTTTRDTPRGLVITISDSGFDNSMLRPSATDTVARLAAVLSQPGLRVSAEGYSDSATGASVAEQRAEAVKMALVRRGVNPNLVSTRNFADARPLTSNATPAGRISNRRVEIVISGDAIGAHPLWDRSYDVTLR